MPRDGSGVYSKPANTTPSANDTIESAKFNTLMDDIATDLNTDRPVVAGGTGASSAADARTNLGLGSIATQAASAVAITGGSVVGITDLAVADGGTGASTAANARTNLGLATVGQAEAEAGTETTARAWTAQRVKQAIDALASGTIVQIVNTETGAGATGTTTFPVDDTIPQSTEGSQFMTLAITPTDSSNILEITVVFNCSHGTTGNLGVALFQDSTANALAMGVGRSAVATGYMNVTFKHRMTAGTTSATTFKVRAGLNNSGTLTMNGTSGSRRGGGTMASSITIKEIAA